MKNKKLVLGILALIILISGAVGYIYWREQQSKGWFQRGNTLPVTQLQPKQSSELENNRIGGNGLCLRFHSESDIYGIIDGDCRMGLKWKRVSLDYWDWTEVEDTGAYSEYSIGSLQDEAITYLADNGIKMMYLLNFWDEEIQPVEEGYSRFKTEGEIQRYLDYVQFIVHNFKDRIEYYEILNEPNNGVTGQYVEVADYINLVKRTVPVIRQEYPEAKIVAGAVIPLYWIRNTAPARIEPGAREYLFSILESDVMPLVDAFSWHAMNGASPEYGEEYYYEYPSLVQEIKDAASAHGFKGEYVAEEMHWPIPQEAGVWGDAPIYSNTKSAKYYARGIVMHLGMNVAAGICGPFTIKNLGTVMAGAEPTNLPIEIQSKATNIRSYSFSLSNGDKLIALWTDGVAADDDPGVRANLTVQDTTSEDVTATDVLNGYQQSITTTSENGSLVIRNLIVRDYPLILHIT